MDTWLYRGDHKRDQRGFPQKVWGAAEKIQQAMIRLSVKKGDFALDKELGSKLYTLVQVPKEQREELALEYAREAVLPINDVEVVSVVCKDTDVEQIVLEIVIEYNGKDAPQQQFLFLWEFTF